MPRTKRNFKAATGYIAITLFLGIVFLGIKGYEYNSKFSHDILPGRIGEALPDFREAEGPQQARQFYADGIQRDKAFHSVGMQYVDRVRAQIEKIVLKAAGKDKLQRHSGVTGGEAEHIKECFHLYQAISDPKRNGRRSPMRYISQR